MVKPSMEKYFRKVCSNIDNDSPIYCYLNSKGYNKVSNPDICYEAVFMMTTGVERLDYLGVYKINLFTNNLEIKNFILNNKEVTAKTIDTIKDGNEFYAHMVERREVCLSEVDLDSFLVVVFEYPNYYTIDLLRLSDLKDVSVLENQFNYFIYTTPTYVNAILRDMK
jgi:hypothetical protein